ncbi:MAG TPA: sulfur carrier protein ThiS [Rudaea sp.]|nr:sulfur carrier protein ThiS [Rudaea sp.]
MRIRLNGVERELAGPATVADLLEANGYGNRAVAVEVNREIVPKSLRTQHVLNDGDHVEIVHALGGG